VLGMQGQAVCIGSHSPQLKQAVSPNAEETSFSCIPVGVPVSHHALRPSDRLYEYMLSDVSLHASLSVHHTGVIWDQENGYGRQGCRRGQYGCVGPH
jgi:hypothetical protein